MTKKALEKLKINGARELSNADIELLNEITAAELRLLDLHKKVVQRLEAEHHRKTDKATRLFQGHRDNAEQHALDRFNKAEPFRWATFARAEIQKGVMSLKRAIERPNT